MAEVQMTVVGGTSFTEAFAVTLGATMDIGMGHVFRFPDEWVTVGQSRLFEADDQAIR